MRLFTSRHIAALAAAVLAPLAAAQVPVKIDLTQEMVPASSNPRGFLSEATGRFQTSVLAIGAKRYFLATTESSGSELWETDGTPAGTQMAFDFNTGPGDGVQTVAAELGGRILFLGETAFSTQQIWSTDGTKAGTFSVTGTGLGPNPVNTQQLVTSGNLTYFINDTGLQIDLWVTDGTAGGTHELLPDSFGQIYNFYDAAVFPDPVGTGAYFSANIAPFGSSVWHTDGTPAGTVLLADIDPGASLSELGSPVALGNKVIFTSYSPQGKELFVTDGTAGGTYMLADIAPGSQSSTPLISQSGVHNGLLYFSASNLTVGRELFQTDGTSAGTKLVMDAEPGWPGSYPRPLGVAGGKLILTSYTKASGHQLYTLEATGLNRIQDHDAEPYWAKPDLGLEIGNRLILEASGPYSTIMVTDGTDAGTFTFPTSTLPHGSTILGELAQGVVLISGGSETFGFEPMISDGSLAGTVLLKNAQPESKHVGTQFRDIVCADAGDLYVHVYAPNDTELFHVPLSDVPVSVSESADPQYLYSSPKRVWFGDHGELVMVGISESADGGIPALLKTDGTPGGTDTLALIPHMDPLSMFYFLGSNGKGALLFGAHDVNGWELWSSDGTSAGAHVIGDFLSVPGFGTFPSYAVVVDGVYYFSMSDTQGKIGLWRTDGTAPGTSMLAGGLRGEVLWKLHPTVVGDLIYFSADDGSSGLELWVSDGTAAGTKMVTDMVTGVEGSNPTQLLEFAGQLHYFARATIGGPKTLWRTDGTVAGTVQVSNTPLGPKGVAAVAGDYLYFQGESVAAGKEFWAFDGIGDKFLGDLTPGPDGTTIGKFVPSGGRVYFFTSIPGVGSELHFADAQAGTAGLAYDLMPGSAGSNQQFLTACGSSLYFAATGADGDHELYRLETSDAQASDLGFGSTSARLTSTLPKLGGGLTLSIENAPTSAIGILAMSTATSPTGSFVESGGALWIDPLNFALLGFGTTASWSVSQTIPNLPSLAGLHISAQAFFLPPALLPAQTSNGIRLVLGN